MGNLLPFPERLPYMRSTPSDIVVTTHLNFLELRGYTPDTVYCRRRALARLAAALGKPLLDATEQDLAAWRRGLSVGPDTIVHYVSHAREFYRWAIRVGLIEHSPAENLPVPRLGRRLPRPIGESQLLAAVTAAPERIRPWLVLAGWAGLRAKEIAYLRRENVQETRIPALLLIVHDATKGHRERTVPLGSYVLAELQAYGLPRTGYVFRRHDGGPGPNRPWTVSHLSNAYLHEQGIPATLHQLRHRFGTITYQARRDLRMVQELLGHSSPATTAGYAAYDNADAADVVEQLPTPRHLRAVSE